MGGDSRQAANMQKIHVVTERLFWIFDDPPQKPGRMLWQLWQGIIGLLEMGIPNQKGEQSLVLTHHEICRVTKQA